MQKTLIRLFIMGAVAVLGAPESQAQFFGTFPGFTNSGGGGYHHYNHSYSYGGFSSGGYGGSNGYGAAAAPQAYYRVPIVIYPAARPTQKTVRVYRVRSSASVQNYQVAPTTQYVQPAPVYSYPVPTIQSQPIHAAQPHCECAK